MNRGLVSPAGTCPLTLKAGRNTPTEPQLRASFAQGHALLLSLNPPKTAVLLKALFRSYAGFSFVINDPIHTGNITGAINKPNMSLAAGFL